MIRAACLLPVKKPPVRFVNVAPLAVSSARLRRAGGDARPRRRPVCPLLEFARVSGHGQKPSSATCARSAAATASASALLWAKHSCVTWPTLQLQQTFGAL